MKEIKSILIRQATVVDKQSEHHLKVCDILIEKGQVKDIGPNLKQKAAVEIAEENLHISPGWFDLRANFRDPGTGDAEDFNSGASAAIAGGFTAVGLSPETEPVTDRKSDIEYVYKAADGLPLFVYPYASLSKNLDGQELSEMFDLHEAGAVAFSHGSRNIKNTALLKLAMLYAREFSPYLHLQAYDASIRASGVMHEGAQSTYLGLKGIPALAEELGVLQALHLSDYAQTGIHLQGISAGSTVALLRQAKADQRLYTADVNLANLVFTDEALAEYDTNLKVYPPIRSKKDKNDLLEALADGTLQVVTSNHEPHAIEAKRCEFDQAAFGAAGLQCFFGALWGATHSKIPLDRLVECISHNPREVLGLESPVVTKGSFAEFTLFNPDQEYRINSAELESQAANNPYQGLKLRGKAIATVVKGTLVKL
jgi:dihydroorotase